MYINVQIFVEEIKQCTHFYRMLKMEISIQKLKKRIFLTLNVLTILQLIDVRFYSVAVVALSTKHLAPDRRALVRVSPCETTPCVPMAPNSFKTCRGCNVLEISIQITPLGVPKLLIILSEADQNFDGPPPEHF